ncbi:G-protein coupled receptor 143 [Hyalella azteca]|uniref:G-protein coupled receptor 143 n=1 Tax=Hyalella azteca TaxID=294128 RepID=A0A8B7NF99_HYAAZ|nr:G-protein coupled receptor 143 [Hyalella azteca]
MASPIVESLCCVPITSELTKQFLSTFRTVEYNSVCLAASVVGVCGALWQLHVLHWWQQQLQLSFVSSRRPRLLRTQASLIVKWLAVSDLCAAAGIGIRSLLWLLDSAASTGASEYDPLSSGRLVCIFMASWIHYFYTCTYMWTCLYCVDCVRSVRGSHTNTVWYHVVAWVVPAVLTFVGLLGLYAPDMKCHSSSTNPYIRFLPNYLSTVLPLLCVLCMCPVLYGVAANTLHTNMAALTGRYTVVERAVVSGVRRRFLLLCLVFWLCWLPNVVNAAVLWIEWNDLPYTALTVLWYCMAVLNPLQAVFNSFVYPSQSARSSHRTSSAWCCRWLLVCITCGFWSPSNSKNIDNDTTRDTDIVDCDEYEDKSSSEYQSASSSPRTRGSRSPDELTALLDNSSLLPHSSYCTKL